MSDEEYLYRIPHNIRMDIESRHTELRSGKIDWDAVMRDAEKYVTEAHRRAASTSGPHPPSEARIGYHVRKIDRGTVGQLSKIREELEEAEDAESQGNRVMLLLELSDIIGAIDCYLGKQFADFSLEDLVCMARATKRSFESGER